MPTFALLCPWQYIDIHMWGYASLVMASMLRALPSRWRSVWTWSNRCHTALTRSWPPACRVSRAPTWRRDLSSHRLWVLASVTASDIDMLLRAMMQRHRKPYWSCAMLLLCAFRKNSRSPSWHSVWWKGRRCWGTTLCWGEEHHLNTPDAHTPTQIEASSTIDLAIEFLSVLVYSCLRSNGFGSPADLAQQEDAEAVWGDGGETGPGAHPVREPDRERCSGASLCAGWGERWQCTIFNNNSAIIPW